MVLLSAVHVVGRVVDGGTLRRTDVPFTRSLETAGHQCFPPPLTSPVPPPSVTCTISKASSSCPLLVKNSTSFLMSPVATQYGMASSLSSAISWSARLQKQERRWPDVKTDQNQDSRVLVLLTRRTFTSASVSSSTSWRLRGPQIRPFPTETDGSYQQVTETNSPPLWSNQLRLTWPSSTISSQYLWICPSLRWISAASFRRSSLLGAPIPPPNLDILTMVSSWASDWNIQTASLVQVHIQTKSKRAARRTNVPEGTLSDSMKLTYSCYIF